MELLGLDAGYPLCDSRSRWRTGHLRPSGSERPRHARNHGRAALRVVDRIDAPGPMRCYQGDLNVETGNLDGNSGAGIDRSSPCVRILIPAMANGHQYADMDEEHESFVDPVSAIRLQVEGARARAEVVW